MKQLTIVATVAALCCFAACGKSDSKDKAKKTDPATASKPAANQQHTCEQVVDHIYPILQAFRKSPRSPYRKLTKYMDNSLAAVKKRKASTLRVCKQRKYTQAEKHCFMTAKSVDDITSCAAIWRERTGAGKVKLPAKKAAAPAAKASDKTPAANAGDKK